MAYGNLYLQNQDHYDRDKWSTHMLSIPHMTHVWIVITEHLGIMQSITINYFKKNSNYVPYHMHYFISHKGQR